MNDDNILSWGNSIWGALMAHFGYGGKGARRGWGCGRGMELMGK